MPVKVFDEVYDRCPVSILDADACQAISVIEVWEGGGMGGSSISPSAFMEETKWAHNVRQIVLNEKFKIRKFQEKKDPRGRND